LLALSNGQQARQSKNSLWIERRDGKRGGRGDRQFTH
jgi:hypothetical protein